jgi:hypothetical protein
MKLFQEISEDRPFCLFDIRLFGEDVNSALIGMTETEGEQVEEIRRSKQAERCKVLRTPAWDRRRSTSPSVHLA